MVEDPGNNWNDTNILFLSNWVDVVLLLEVRNSEIKAFLGSIISSALDMLFFFLIYYLFICLFLLCWVFASVQGFSLVAVSGGHSSSRCAGLSLSRPLLFRSTGSRRAGSVVVAHGPSCSAACGIFPDQGSNPCPLHWQADSQPLLHQGSPGHAFFLMSVVCLYWHVQ